MGPGNVTRMAARLRAQQSPVETKSYPGTGHIGIILSLVPAFRSRTTLYEDMLAFIQKY